MQKTTLKIINPLGLHARAASKFVNLAKTFEAMVNVGKDGSMADGKSIMNVMLLAAPIGSEVELQVTGPDEEEAFTALSDLINNGFGELDP